MLPFKFKDVSPLWGLFALVLGATCFHFFHYLSEVAKPERVMLVLGAALGFLGAGCLYIGIHHERTRPLDYSEGTTVFQMLIGGISLMTDMLFAGVSQSTPAFWMPVYVFMVILSSLGIAGVLVFPGIAWGRQNTT